MPGINGHDVARNLTLGLVAGAVGTAAMDLLLYRREHSAGRAESFRRWEFAADLDDWKAAPAPGQLGRNALRAVMRRDPPPSWARPTTNLVHWATGVGWGMQFAMVAGAEPRRRWAAVAALGPAAWLASYVVLPPLHVYEPIWKYDAKTLHEDWTAHLLFGVTTGVTFIAGSRALP